MAGKSWIQWLLPVDKKFYGLLGQLGRDVHESSKHLVELTRDEGNREAHLKAIHDLEHKADETARDLYQVTRKSLVHPIGPEDIFRLTRELDDVIDAIESTASRIQILQLTEFPEQCRKSVALLEESCGLIEELVGKLQNGNGAKKKSEKESDSILARVSEIEEILDQMTRQEYGRLVHDSSDWRPVLLWSEIYRRIENASDHCNRTAWLLDEVTARNA